MNWDRSFFSLLETKKQQGKNLQFTTVICRNDIKLAGKREGEPILKLLLLSQYLRRQLK